MEYLKRIPPNIYLIFSFVLITIAIATLFLGNFILAVIALIVGITSLIAWTFLGLFEENKNK
tara:strand:+ start:125 stop:310 length:186 start_codon:yes stop_codon:yes gene_type:complete